MLYPYRPLPFYQLPSRATTLGYQACFVVHVTSRVSFRMICPTLVFIYGYCPSLFPYFVSLFSLACLATPPIYSLVQSPYLISFPSTSPFHPLLKLLNLSSNLPFLPTFRTILHHLTGYLLDSISVSSLSSLLPLRHTPFLIHFCAHISPSI